MIEILQFDSNAHFLKFMFLENCMYVYNHVSFVTFSSFFFNTFSRSVESSLKPVNYKQTFTFILM